MTILLIEDNRTDLKLIRSVLQRAGHTVTTAVNAKQAVEILQSETPQVILTDLDLPQMDGLSFARELKLIPKSAGVPIIAITSYPDHYLRSEVRAAGIVGYFVKPINTRTLSQQILDVLAKV